MKLISHGVACATCSGIESKTHAEKKIQLPNNWNSQWYIYFVPTYTQTTGKEQLFSNLWVCIWGEESTMRIISNLSQPLQL